MPAKEIIFISKTRWGYEKDIMCDVASSICIAGRTNGAYGKTRSTGHRWRSG